MNVSRGGIDILRISYRFQEFRPANDGAESVVETSRPAGLVSIFSSVVLHGESKP